MALGATITMDSNEEDWQVLLGGKCSSVAPLIVVGLLAGGCLLLLCVLSGSQWEVGSVGVCCCCLEICRSLLSLSRGVLGSAVSIRIFLD